MKFKNYFLALLALPVSVFSQEKELSCSQMKSKHVHSKSNNLTIAQIAETERYDVHFYFLDLNMTNLNTSISGSTEIHASARVNLDSAIVELFDTFVISDISVDGLSVAYNRTNSALTIPVNKLANENFVIRIVYAGTPPNASTNPLGGGGMTNATSPSWGNQVTWSLSEPYSAYEWFPVKQSLKDKSDSCAVFITVPTACKAGSNGVLEQVVDLGNGTHRFEWKHRNPIDHYLISVAIAEYIDYTITSNPIGSGPVTIQNYIYNNPQTLINFQNDIDETADFIELFATLFGPYPFANEKYGHCMAPLGGGMEHQTMTTQGYFNKGLTSHELAHQWWGDHVTCASWSDIWVNEGFATYGAYLMLENLYPAERAQDMMDKHLNIQSTNSGSVWVEDSLNTGRIFSNRLTYDKGAAIIHTLRFLINNDSLFFAALKQYQVQYANSTALGVDFIQVVENVTGQDFTNFMQEWYFGEGHPIYSVRWNTVGTDVLVEINQQGATPAVTPFFTNDLELRFDRTGIADTNMRFTITGTQNQFLIPNPGNITNILSIDPNNWICNGDFGIAKDVNFVVGIDELADENPLTIYPNPTNGPVTVEMKTAGKYALTVVDNRGKIVFNQTFSQTTSVDLSAAAQGTYLIQVTSLDSDLKLRRLIKR